MLPISKSRIWWVLDWFLKPIHICLWFWYDPELSVLSDAEIQSLTKSQWRSTRWDAPRQAHDWLILSRVSLVPVEGCCVQICMQICVRVGGHAIWEHGQLLERRRWQKREAFEQRLSALVGELSGEENLGRSEGTTKSPWWNVPAMFEDDQRDSRVIRQGTVKGKWPHSF